jgi:excisionase family DNA binding protein
MESTNRVTVQEAARLLGISEGAVRARIHRGTLETAREGGTVYVRIDGENTPKERTEQTELVQALREHNTTLERQLNAEREASAELRRIIAALTQRIPELEAPKQESPEAPTEATEQPGRVEDQAVIRSPQTSSERVPWWRRFFGGHEG